MKNAINLIGKKYNDVEVISLSDKRDNQNKLLWLCRCVCSKEFLVRGYSLKKIKSCGCKNIEKKRDINMAINQKYSIYKRDANKRNLEFNISKELFGSIIQLDCFYCGESPKMWSPYIDKKGNIKSTFASKGVDIDYMYETIKAINGIDRKDNTLGYTLENIVPCCPICNYMKNIYSQEDFLKHIDKIHNFQKAIEDKTLIKI